MDDHGIHRSRAADGAGIAGRVYGQGPPLVLVHGGLGDGETSWRFVLPTLAARFTCYTMSTRGRGLSEDHADHSIDAYVDDVVAFAASLGQPVGVVGHSSSLALAAAAQTDAIHAVAVHEPAVPALAADDPYLHDAMQRAFAAADEERHVDAVRILFQDSRLFLQDEVATLVQQGAYERMAPNVPSWCAVVPEAGKAVDPDVLHKVRVPTLLLQGSRSPQWFRESVRFVAGHLTDVRVREIPGAGHMAPVVAPRAVADELARFVAGEHAEQ